jgi:hypothetical protein
VIAALVTGGFAVHRQFEVTTGDTPIAEALAAL